MAYGADELLGHVGQAQAYLSRGGRRAAAAPRYPDAANHPRSYNQGPMAGLPVCTIPYEGESDVSGKESESTDDALVHPGVRVDVMKWGFPHAKKPNKPVLNARAETLGRTKLFSVCLESRRCVIPVLGFYEWRDEPDQVCVYV